jgi:hypothetical protein
MNPTIELTRTNESPEEFINFFHAALRTRRPDGSSTPAYEPLRDSINEFGGTALKNSIYFFNDGLFTF